MMRLVPGLLLLFLLQINAHAGELEKGVAAFDAGKYQQAIDHWLPLAEGDNAEAQLFMGVLYRHGLGVEMDPKQAAYWYERAANNGDVDAQGEMGFIYEQGWGVPQDIWIAESWYDLVQQHDVCVSDTLPNGRLIVEDHLK